MNETPLPKSTKRGFGPLQGLARWLGDEEPTTRPVVSTDEVFALLKYSAEQGKDRDKIKALSAEIHQEKRDLSEVAALYADLVAETVPVTGRTILDSAAPLRRMIGISTVTSLFFILALGNYIADSWISDLVLPEDDTLLFDLKRYVWDHLTPFLWGGLGSCVYLMKSIQDKARFNVYEGDYIRKWRLLLTLRHFSVN